MCTRRAAQEDQQLVNKGENIPCHNVRNQEAEVGRGTTTGTKIPSHNNNTASNQTNHAIRRMKLQI